ncbi:hypothetical protein [Flavobacterium aestivum]|uniref:hypothetical protein n=1 Tax=Flavobacterium aestivum TaxID=3003257 RepID=UPI0022858F78|nr:hypothetical protein [Flavobacterium aestivum]
MKKIRIHPDMAKELAEEFKTTRQTVYAALCYFNNSELGKKIRAGAKAKLLKEAEDVVISDEPNQEK